MNKSKKYPGQPDNEIWFYDSSMPYYEFANFWPVSFAISDIPENLTSLGVSSNLTGDWKTSEHLFQAAKFTDLKIIEEIRRASEPRTALFLGRKYGGWIIPGWHGGTKVEVMRWAVKQKFSQHSELKELLWKTGKKGLVEHTTKDNFWGDNGDKSGQNWLGRILMEVRQEIVAEKGGEWVPPVENKTKEGTSKSTSSETEKTNTTTNAEEPKSEPEPDKSSSSTSDPEKPKLKPKSDSEKNRSENSEPIVPQSPQQEMDKIEQQNQQQFEKDQAQLEKLISQAQNKENSEQLIALLKEIEKYASTAAYKLKEVKIKNLKEKLFTKNSTQARVLSRQKVKDTLTQNNLSENDLDPADKNTLESLPGEKDPKKLQVNEEKLCLNIRKNGVKKKLNNILNQVKKVRDKNKKKQLKNDLIKLLSSQDPIWKEYFEVKKAEIENAFRIINQRSSSSNYSQQSGLSSLTKGALVAGVVIGGVVIICITVIRFKSRRRPKK